MTIAPSRSHARRREALAYANVVRSRRATAKRDIAGNRSLAVDHLLDPPDWMQSMRAWDLLLAVPRVGKVKANRILRSCQVSPSKTLGGMSDRQRRELVRWLSA